MVIVESDRAEISIFILAECEKLRLDLNESTRTMLNAKALGIFCREKTMAKMAAQMGYEIKLLAPANISRGTDREIVISETGELRKETAIIAYLRGIGCELYRDGKTRWTILPKSYSVANVKKRISAIRNG